MANTHLRPPSCRGSKLLAQVLAQGESVDQGISQISSETGIGEAELLGILGGKYLGWNQASSLAGVLSRRLRMPLAAEDIYMPPHEVLRSFLFRNGLSTSDFYQHFLDLFASHRIIEHYLTGRRSMNRVAHAIHDVMRDQYGEEIPVEHLIPHHIWQRIKDRESREDAA